MIGVWKYQQVNRSLGDILLCRKKWQVLGNDMSLLIFQQSSLSIPRSPHLHSVVTTSPRRPLPGSQGLGYFSWIWERMPEKWFRTLGPPTHPTYPVTCYPYGFHLRQELFILGATAVPYLGTPGMLPRWLLTRKTSLNIILSCLS